MESGKTQYSEVEYRQAGDSSVEDSAAEDSRPPNISNRFNFHSVRLQHIVHVDTMLVDSTFVEPARALIEADLSDVRQALMNGGFKFPGVRQAQSVVDLEEFLGKVASMHHVGYLAKAQHPYYVIEAVDRIGYSWDKCRSQWFFARKYDTVLDIVCEWASFHHEEAWARARSTFGAVGPTAS
ncbi:hypothetical protein [Caballeronia sp. SBC2]|uniref:hypothetical protein n=1 Tax=Caballeronia sp. SBC2 TaxID=2705547 RepID=UPI0013E12E24|nr:hypothetical protein [Caballeronia sp. SBC2]QIE30185.1 hypothetical protein SBC2_82610 [Caballeronia sp. SBC2]